MLYDIDWGCVQGQEEYARQKRVEKGYAWPEPCQNKVEQHSKARDAHGDNQRPKPFVVVELTEKPARVAQQAAGMVEEFEQKLTTK